MDKAYRIGGISSHSSAARLQVHWGASTFQQRRIDAWRLLHQVSAISKLERIDPSGLLQLRVSRTEPDEVGSGLDVSQEPKFRNLLLHTAYYGPAYFRHNSDPYTTLALAGARVAGVSVAEVNFTLVWDLVRQMKVGEHGFAYVIDAEGRLIFHSDVSFERAQTDVSRSPRWSPLAPRPPWASSRLSPVSKIHQ